MKNIEMDVVSILQCFVLTHFVRVSSLHVTNETSTGSTCSGGERKTTRVPLNCSNTNGTKSKLNRSFWKSFDTELRGVLFELQVPVICAW